MFEEIENLLNIGEYEKAIEKGKEQRKIIKESSKDKAFKEYLDRMMKNLTVVFYNHALGLYKKQEYDIAIPLLHFSLLCMPGEYHSLTLLGRIYTDYGKTGTRNDIVTNLSAANEYLRKANNSLRDLIKGDRVNFNGYNKRINDNHEVVLNNSYRLFQLGYNTQDSNKLLASLYKNDMCNEKLGGIYAISSIHYGNIQRAEDVLSVNKLNNYYSMKAQALLEVTYSKFADAEATMERAMELAEGSDEKIDAIVLLCRLYLRNGRAEDALTLLKKSLEQYPDNMRLIYELINAYIATKQYEDAFNLVTQYEQQLIGFFKLKREDGNMWKCNIAGMYEYLLTVLGYTKDNYSLVGTKDRIEQKLIIEGHSGVKDVPRISNKHKNKFDDIFDTITERLKVLKPNFVGFHDEYVVDVGTDCGLFHTIATSKFKVSTYSNTKRIIDITPTCGMVSESEKNIEKEMS